METQFFTELTIVLSVSLIASAIFQRLRQPSILAYILVGCLLGPSAFGAVTDLKDFAFLSEFGVVFLLFALGLEFSLDRLITMRRAVFVLGGIQVAVCTGVFWLTLKLWDIGWAPGFVLAGALAFSSTAIVTKLLSDRRELGYDYSQLAIGILLFQDLAAVTFLIITPTLGGTGDTSLLVDLAIALGKGLALFALLIAIGKFVLPRIYHEVARLHSQETFVLSTLVIVLAAAWITHELHMSMALGGFVIGMMLGGSHFRHQIETDIRPFKDILLGLFFVSVGLQINLSVLGEYWPRILLAAAALLIFKTALIFGIGRSLGERPITALRAGITLSQGGEFGFALIALASLSGLLSNAVSSFMLLVIIISMLISPFLISRARPISSKVFPDQTQLAANRLGPDADIHTLEGHVIIGGFGRIGETLADFLTANRIPYIALDSDIDLVNRCRRRGNHNVIYGDCTRLEMLKASGLADARLVMLSIRIPAQAAEVVTQIRHLRPELPIIVRAHHESAFEELLVAGADRVVPEMLETSFMVATQSLLLLGLDEEAVVDQVREERERRAGGLRDAPDSGAEMKDER